MPYSYNTSAHIRVHAHVHIYIYIYMCVYMAQPFTQGLVVERHHLLGLAPYLHRRTTNGLRKGLMGGRGKVPIPSFVFPRGVGTFYPAVRAHSTCCSCSRATGGGQSLMPAVLVPKVLITGMRIFISMFVCMHCHINSHKYIYMYIYDVGWLSRWDTLPTRPLKIYTCIHPHLYFPP